MENLEIGMFKKIYSGKKVLITGNTGFKGSWLSAWLLQLDAKVYGISIDIPTKPSIFEALELEKKVVHHYADINDLDEMKKIISDIQPDFLFHLAAQPIVSLSYTNPVQTFQTNVIGTANILEALRLSNHPCTAIIISSDKCYENIEWLWGYKETDHLGGKDPYSASKGACEVVVHSYYHSFFKNSESKVRIVSARSGNVIGGGDWSPNRLIPDCIKAWQSNQKAEIRHPDSVRPWQHVLEPLSGYLSLGQVLHEDVSKNGEPYNFGPSSSESYTVLEMLSELSSHWDKKNHDGSFFVDKKKSFYEASVLKLNCDKATDQLKWRPTLEFGTAVELTASWYKAFYEGKKNMYSFTSSQIDEYTSLAAKKNLSWAHP
ncbi:MAG TPA: CDP-glucose 4,6-dehydratase [Puia sp.]|nr:CDP-glucose 4,6-dehydratase [Puia sp.]